MSRMCRSKQRACAPVAMAPSTSPGLPGMLARLRATPFALPVLWNHPSPAVNDIRPGEEDVRRTAARELGTGVQDRQLTRTSTANHHLSSAHGARTQGGRGAQVLHPLLGSSATRHQPGWFTMLVRLQKGRRTSTLGTG